MSIRLDHLIVRQALRADLSSILQLYRELAGAYNLDNCSAAKENDVWDILSKDPRQYLLVAENDGVIIGTLTVIVIPNIGHGCRPWAAVENVIVDETCRGMGVGNRLMAEATRLCREFGCYKIILSSNLVRRQAHAFYRRLGWRQSHIGFSVEL